VRLERTPGFHWPSLREAVLDVLRDHGAAGTLSIAVVGDDRIRALHRDFMGIDSPTDVITFPLVEPGSPADGVLGEIVVSADTALREARRRKIPPDRELALYAIHGALHLVGHDDMEPRAKRRMRREEARYLARYVEARRRALGQRRMPSTAPSRSSRPRRGRRPSRGRQPDPA
jgi:probable rRNA maturation factor